MPPRMKRFLAPLANRPADHHAAMHGECHDGNGHEMRAEVRLPTQELRDDLPFFTKVLGLRLDMIFPADNPEVAVLSGHGLRLRIQKGAAEAAGHAAHPDR
jgi:hypothetical protein